LAVIAPVQFVLLLNISVVNVALPSIRHHFNLSDVTLTWVVTAYMIAAGSLLLLGGRIGDVIGLKRAFIVGIGLYGLASLSAALAPTAWVLIASTAGQGVGEALAGATGLAMLSMLFPSGPERAKAFTLWAAIAGIGSTVGVVVSGLLTDYFSWRWVFGINVPLIGGLAVACILLVPPMPAGRRVRLDISLAVATVTAMAGLVWGLAGTSLEGLWLVRVLLVAAGAAGMAAVLWASRRGQDRIVPARLLQRSPRLVGYAIIGVQGAVNGAVFFLGALLMQDLLGFSPTQAGFAWLPCCLGFFPGLWLSRVIQRRWSPRAAATVGLAMNGAAMAVFALGTYSDLFVVVSLPVSAVMTAGLGCVSPVSQSWATLGLKGGDAGAGGALPMTVQQLANAAGIALFASVAAALTIGPQAAAFDRPGFAGAFWVGSAVMVGIAIVAWRLAPRGR